MTQLIVVNDTGAQIAAAAAITLDGVFAGPPIAEIISGSLVNFCDGTIGATTKSATPTAITATASAPTSGNYAYLATNKSIKLGVAMDVWQILILNVRLEGEIVTPKAS